MSLMNNRDSADKDIKETLMTVWSVVFAEVAAVQSFRLNMGILVTSQWPKNIKALMTVALIICGHRKILPSISPVSTY